MLRRERGADVKQDTVLAVLITGLAVAIVLALAFWVGWL
jgi:hypothetical protein